MHSTSLLLRLEFKVELIHLNFEFNLENLIIMPNLAKLSNLSSYRTFALALFLRATIANVGVAGRSDVSAAATLNPRLTYGESYDEMTVTFYTANTTTTNFHAGGWVSSTSTPSESESEFQSESEIESSESFIFFPAEVSRPPNFCGTHGPHTHVVRFKNLKPNVLYRYKVGNESESICNPCSLTYTFRTAKKPGSGGQSSFAIVGDMGLTWSSTTINVLAKYIQNPATDFDFLFHNGDIAYADSAYYHIGHWIYQDWLDWFFTNTTRAFSAVRPYMLGIGNHERICGRSEYEQRAWANPRKIGDDPMVVQVVKTPEISDSSIPVSPSPEYHARIHDNIYFLSLSAEAGRLDHFDSAHFRWLKYHLKRALSLKKAGVVSWILTFVHYPHLPTGYCSYNCDYCCNPADWKLGGKSKTTCGLGVGLAELNQTVWAKTEDLFLEYEVDVHFTAHEHVFERMEPTYRYKLCPNMKKTVEEDSDGSDSVSSNSEEVTVDSNSSLKLNQDQASIISDSDSDTNVTMKPVIYDDPHCPMFVVLGSSGDLEVFPNKWFREPEYVYPSRTNSFGFGTVRATNEELRMQYLTVGTRVPGDDEAFVADDWKIRKSRKGQEEKRRGIRGMLGGASQSDKEEMGGATVQNQRNIGPDSLVYV